MENNPTYTNRCPSMHDFESMLKGSASAALKLDFHKHLESCELCSLAYEGYRLNNVRGISELIVRKSIVKKSPLRYVAYAATIAMMVGSYAFFQNMAENKTGVEPLFVSDAFTEFEEVTVGAKKLMAKNQEDYWHISAEGELSLNDQSIKLEEIDKAKLEHGRKAFVELKTNDESVLTPLMDKLKNEKDQKVFTLSKNRNLNPITRLGTKS